jgi:hypothetical protein
MEIRAKWGAKTFFKLSLFVVPAKAGTHADAEEAREILAGTRRCVDPRFRGDDRFA